MLLNSVIYTFYLQKPFHYPEILSRIYMQSIAFQALNKALVHKFSREFMYNYAFSFFSTSIFIFLSTFCQPVNLNKGCHTPYNTAF